MSVDELVLAQSGEEEALLPAGQHAIVPKLTRAVIHGATDVQVREIEGVVTTATTGMEIELGGLLTAPVTARSTAWPMVGILQTFPGLHVEVRTVLWSGAEGLGLGMLTLAGISKPAAFDVEVRGISVSPDGAADYFVSLATWIDTAQWGLEGGRTTKITFALAVAS